MATQRTPTPRTPTPRTAPADNTADAPVNDPTEPTLSPDALADYQLSPEGRRMWPRDDDRGDPEGDRYSQHGHANAQSDRSPTADVGLDDAAASFNSDWLERQESLKHSPITRFIKAHERAGTPNEMTITGVADVKVTLGDLREYARLLTGDE